MLTMPKGVGLTVALGLLSGCVSISWRRVPEGLQETFPPRARREIWIGEQPARVCTIAVHGDTLHATVARESTVKSCSKFAVYWLTSRIDSVRAPYIDVGKAAGRTGVLVLIAGVLYALRCRSCE